MVTRPDGSSVFLGPSLTQPHREIAKVEIVTTSRGPVAQARPPPLKSPGSEEKSGLEEESDEDEDKF